MQKQREVGRLGGAARLLEGRKATHGDVESLAVDRTPGSHYLGCLGHSLIDPESKKSRNSCVARHAHNNAALHNWALVDAPRSSFERCRPKNRTRFGVVVYAMRGRRRNLVFARLARDLPIILVVACLVVFSLLLGSPDPTPHSHVRRVRVEHGLVVVSVTVTERTDHPSPSPTSPTPTASPTWSPPPERSQKVSASFGNVILLDDVPEEVFSSLNGGGGAMVQFRLFVKAAAPKTRSDELSVIGVTKNGRVYVLQKLLPKQLECERGDFDACSDDSVVRFKIPPLNENPKLNNLKFSKWGIAFKSKFLTAAGVDDDEKTVYTRKLLDYDALSQRTVLFKQLRKIKGYAFLEISKLQ